MNAARVVAFLVGVALVATGLALLAQWVAFVFVGAVLAAGGLFVDVGGAA